MLICEGSQIRNEEQIEEELNIGRLFIMLKLGVVEQSLIMCIYRCLVRICTLLRFSLYLFLASSKLSRLAITHQRTLPKWNAVVAHIDWNELLPRSAK